jgi:signal transduction histidine kinase/ActR/RegA family two-component response regulator/HAMP domain-containing protein
LKTFKPMPGFSSLRVRLVGAVFMGTLPAMVVFYFTRLPWIGFVIGLLALVAAWIGGELFVVRKMRDLLNAVQRLGTGDLSSRTGMAQEKGEIGQLAKAFDNMATALDIRAREREQAEQRALDRALQQTAVAALGQFALTHNDFAALLHQTVILVPQTLEVEFCRILELLPGSNSMLIRAGTGWKKETVGLATISAEPGTQAGFTLSSGEPVVITDLRTDTRFQSEPLLVDHAIVSGVNVAIGAQDKVYGVLGVYSGRRRAFTSDDVQFLLAVANALAVSVQRRRSEADLRKLAEFAQLNPNAALELTADGAITYFNQAARELAESVKRQHPRDVLPPDMHKLVQSCLATGQGVPQLETRLDGRVLSWSLHPVIASQVVHAYVSDITERLNLEAQLRQSQKMDSIGQLAAGVAHDFNNMLTVIQGHAGMLLARSTLPPDLKESAQAVHSAAERAAALTRQLLLFSRKSVVQPALLDLREIVGNLSKMLKRLIGETVVLEFTPPASLPFVHGDAGMIEQILMNLAVNARDAMSFGGKLSLAVETVSVDAAQVRLHPEARVGSFVCLSVKDTGSGMDAATLNRIFEPFFTTKEPGKGTGLGLATVYGAVKLHQGWIEVSSEVGKGTLFRIYFPATGETAEAGERADAMLAQIRGGGETILLVEDDASVLKLGRVILQDCGYKVVEAGSGVEALDLWQKHPAPIDLLLTDMVMPQGMSGIDLAQKLLVLKPGLKIIFTSGYSINDLDTDFIRGGGGYFLQKPYTRTTLARAVRETLDKPQAGSQAQKA